MKLIGDIEFIGFFHFVQDHDKPIPSLSQALKEKDISRSLVVLPEGFNKGTQYNNPFERKKFVNPQAILNELQDLSRSGGAFVVGLLKPPDGYNSAYLVDRCGSHEMRRKQYCDSTIYQNSSALKNQANYKPCAKLDCNVANPIDPYRGLCIVALICGDIQHYVPELSTKIHGSRSRRKVICIPASMSKNEWPSFGDVPSLGSAWRGTYVVMANSDPSGSGSFITNTSGMKVLNGTDVKNGNYCGLENTVVLGSFDELESRSSVEIRA